MMSVVFKFNKLKSSIPALALEIYFKIFIKFFHFLSSGN